MSLGSVLHFLTSVVFNVAAYLVPAYSSFKALELRTGLEPWLTYWVVFGVLCVVEFWTYWIVSRIPLWTVIKLAFVIWMQLYNTHGARTIYVQGILPLLKKHQIQIDKHIEAGQTHLRTQMAQLGFTSGQSDAPGSSSGFESLSQAASRFQTSAAAAKADIEDPNNAA